jgi:hypothetical protein
LGQFAEIAYPGESPNREPAGQLDMPPAYLIGLGAGLVSGVLFTSLIPHTLLAIVLFYLAPAPVFLAALGWGPTAGVMAALAGSLIPMAAKGLYLAGAYAAFVALPSIAMCRLALQYRVAAPGSTATPNLSAALSSGIVEWYPEGRLFAWAAVLGGLLVAVTIPLVSGSVESYEGAIKPLFTQVFIRELGHGDVTGLSRQQVDDIAGLFARRFVPAVAAALWVGAMMFNFWAASKVAAVSGLLSRPEPKFSLMTFPDFVLPCAGAALVLSFVSGFPGIMANAFLGAFAFAFLILGLIVIRAITEGAGAAQPILLGLLYISVFVLGWPALFIVPIGAAEPFFRLRERAQARLKPPRG